jgi:HAD superfamily hydrolase (TIGR01490 family)
MRPARVAFFDVDETLITVKSMFTFLRWWMVRRDGDERAYLPAVARIQARVTAGVDRMEINRLYYRLLAGVPQTELDEAGRTWWRQFRQEPTAFVASTRAALAGHRAVGDTVVLVSGSFASVLGPLAEEVGADDVLCTEPIVGGDGRLTGDVTRPMIGANKGAAVRSVLSARGAVAADCFCYGDHASDLDMLTAVGHPRVVGGDPVLLAAAATGGWPVLPVDATSTPASPG